MAKRPPKKLSYTNVAGALEDLASERADWEAEWRDISDYLIPGRGIFQTFTKPKKRKLTSPKVVNAAAEDALGVLVSEIYGRLTSPSKPWYKLEWANKAFEDIIPLRAWMQSANQIMNDALHRTNFYETIVSFYEEYIGFGTASMYVGEDTGTDELPFWFYTFTAGEYYFSLGRNGKPDQYIRTIFLTEKQLYDRFGADKVSSDVRQRVESNRGGINTPKRLVVEYLIDIPYDNLRPWTRVSYELTGNQAKNVKEPSDRQPLEYTGFYEFPYPTARYSTIGSDVYGLGPGSRTLPDNKRLQELEKTFLMAVHKSADPPVQAPGRMKGKLNTLPGAYNYYPTPNEMVKELYQVRINFEGLGAAIDRVEQRIKKGFHNDIFLTSNRDPNATPYKATEAAIRDQEKLLRLGPMVEKLQYEFLLPLVNRCFQILLRKDQFPPLPPEYAELVAEYTIDVISPLATAQRGAALQGINSFLAFVGQAAQFTPEAMDNVDIDRTVETYADITGVDATILNDRETKRKIRLDRAKQIAAKQQQENQIGMAQLQAELDLKKAQTAKLMSEANESSMSSQETAQQIGLS